MSFCVVIFSSTNIRWSDSCSVVISTAEILLPKNQAGNCFHRGGVKSKKVQNIIKVLTSISKLCFNTIYWEMKKKFTNIVFMYCLSNHQVQAQFFIIFFNFLVHYKQGKMKVFFTFEWFSILSLFDIIYYSIDALLSTLEVVVLWWFAGMRSRFIPLILQSFCDSWFCTCCLSLLLLLWK